VAEAHELADADLSLPNGDVVRDVLLGSGGLLGHLRSGQTMVDTSTIGHATTLEVGEALAARGVDFLDAPVSGMEARAVEGTLTVMCGGDRAVYDRVEPYLRTFGNNHPVE
jgi:3-hydroxyisobutyrate dehydrogenase-like beta-hydroxyacid dehydrogenase